MLTRTGDIVDSAARLGKGVGAFNVIQLEHAEALVAGAEAAGAPIILQISENTVRYHGALEPIALATLAVARASTARVAVHLDHATDPELVRTAAVLGFGSIMFDASSLSYEDNVAATEAVVRLCHDRGVYVEAELGEIGGKDGLHVPGARTDPKQAREYVEATHVDALAVAIGTSHAMQTRNARVDLDLIVRLRDAVPAPLVMHGSSGVPEADLTKAVRAGMTKINIATHLNAALTAAVRSHLDDHPDVVDPRTYLGRGRDAVSAEVVRLLQVVLAV